MITISEPLNGEPSREWAKRVLLENIVYLNLTPGSPISDKEIAAQMSLSRTPVREALLLLEEMRFVKVYPQRGTFVSLLDVDDIEESRYLRKCLEADTLIQATRNFSSDSLIKMEANLRMQKKAVAENDKKRFLHLDQFFHYLICEGCGRSRVWPLIQRNSLHFFRVRRLKVSEGYMGQGNFLEQHHQLSQSIRDGDAERALYLLNAHLSWDVKAVCSAYPHLFTKKSPGHKPYLPYLFTSELNPAIAEAL